jgi:hypothetical protein
VGNSCRLADVSLEIEGSEPGLHGWTIECGRDAQVDLDGIRTTLITTSPELAPTDPASGSSIGRHRAVRLDHVVVNTDDIERTSSAIERELDLPMRREREVGNGVVQRFHTLDNTIIEVVTGPHVKSVGASLWGMVISVDDLFDLADELGEDVTSPPKRATQPGRYISTVRGSVGLGVPFAMMTPHVPGHATR